jgi:hypothetical protein
VLILGEAGSAKKLSASAAIEGPAWMDGDWRTEPALDEPVVFGVPCFKDSICVTLSGQIELTAFWHRELPARLDGDWGTESVLEEATLCDGSDLKDSLLIASTRGNQDDAEFTALRREDFSSASSEAESALEAVIREGLAFVVSTGVTSVGGENDAVL